MWIVVISGVAVPASSKSQLAHVYSSDRNRRCDNTTQPMSI